MSGEVFIPAALTSIRVEREKGKKKEARNDRCNTVELV
jgi:hypothetical protein